MDDFAKLDNTVNGYLFGSESDVKLAKQELNTVRYIDKKIQGMDLNTLMTVYKSALEKRMFRTPVGYAYLHDLQKKMVSLGCPVDIIPPIPLYQVFGNVLSEEDKPKRRTVTVPKKKDTLHKKNAQLRLAVWILSILVIILFAISLSGSSVTVLNYRNKIQNEYSEWNQELTEREKAVKLKERELLIYNE